MPARAPSKTSAATVELRPEAGLLHEVGRHQRGKRVAGGDARCAENVRPERRIDGKGGGRDRGPHPAAQEQDRHQGDSGRRPHRRDLAVHLRKLQAETGSDEVGDKHDRQPQPIAGQTRPPDGHPAEYRHRAWSRQSDMEQKI